LAWAKRSYKEECGWVVRTDGWAEQYKWPKKTLTPPVTAQVTFVCDNRRRDPDNHMAMLKPLWDALVEMGVLEDDSRDVLRILDPKWERGEKKIVVELEGSVV
jgi:Holliday junction resolvase RusA-like endonuclease